MWKFQRRISELRRLDRRYFAPSFASAIAIGSLAAELSGERTERNGAEVRLVSASRRVHLRRLILKEQAGPGVVSYGSKSLEMKISLSPDIERLITERIQSGRYASADEVVREGLELLREHERRQQASISNGSRPVAEIFEKIAAQVPESEWEKVPSDLSSNVDRYLSERNRS